MDLLNAAARRRALVAARGMLLLSGCLHAGLVVVVGRHGGAEQTSIEAPDPAAALEVALLDPVVPARETAVPELPALHAADVARPPAMPHRLARPAPLPRSPVELPAARSALAASPATALESDLAPVAPPTASGIAASRPSSDAATAAAAGSGPPSPAAPPGPAAPPTPPGPSPLELGGFMASYGASVHARVVAQVRFPEAAARAGVSGTVIVELAIDGTGRLVGVRVVGDAPALLRPAALEAVARAVPFAPPPAPLVATGQPLVFQLPVRFVLR